MARRTLLWGTALVPSLLLGPIAQRPAEHVPPAGRAADDAACRICHPGATRGLRHSVHATLLDDEATRATACSACHGDAAEHARSARRPEDARVAAGPVAAASCAACHHGDYDEGHAVALGAHPWRRREVLESAAERGEPTTTPAAAPARGLAGFDWSGLITAGYRMVHRGGARGRFDSDVDLDPGARLRELELRGTGDSAWLDRLDARARDIGDPDQAATLELGKADRYAARSSFDKAVWKYRAAGDYHRVDRTSQVADYRLGLELGADLGLDLGFRRASDDGFWLASRIGNQNVTPQTVVTGVASPRRTDRDDVDVALRGELGGTAFSLGADYRDQRERARWSFARPAPANPAATESEDFASTTTLRGPGLRLGADRSFGPVTVAVTGRYLDLDRRVGAAGTATGFDFAPFTTDTTAAGAGEAHTLLLDGSLVWEIGDTAALLLDAGWRDHRERMRLLQTDVTTQGGATTTLVQNLDHRTSQRVLHGSAELELRPHDALTVSGGWGFGREALRVPDLVAGDPDFARGEIDDDGVLLGVQWRPGPHWRARLRYTEFGQNGPQLHELVDDEARGIDGRAGWHGDGGHLEATVRHDRSRNDSAWHRRESTSYGVNGSLRRGGGLDLSGSYVFTRADSRTLTSFWFDPDPNPVPTVVGFRGDTHTLAAALRATPSAEATWLAGVAWTKTSGSFDVTLLDWHLEVAAAVRADTELGLEYRRIEYSEDGGLDDYHADLLWLFCRVRLGGGEVR